MTKDRESFAQALDDRDVTLALTPAQLILLVLGIWLLLRDRPRLPPHALNEPMPNAVEPPSESPTRLEAAYALLADGDGPAWRPVAGGTDLMVQVTGEIGEPPERVLDIWGLDELRGIAVETDALVLGALTTYTEIRQSPLVAEFLPALVEAAGTIGAAQIQNRGTIGGNVINASPAGDTLPVLLACGAEMVLGSAGGERTVAADDFWPAYRTTARRRR